MHKRIVITHPKWGIYLGFAMGLGFWSLLDSVGQPAACAFENEAEARNFVAEWSNRDVIPDLKFVPVECVDPQYAMVGELAKAGLGELLGDMPDNLQNTSSRLH